MENNINNLIRVNSPTEATAWIDRNFGIRDKTEFDIHKRFDPCEKVINVFLTTFREFSYHVTTRIKNFFADNSEYQSLSCKKTNRNALIVFCGSWGKTSIWDKHIRKFQELFRNNPGIEEKDVDFFTIEAPVQTSDIGEQIRSNIQKWATQNPNKPIVLFGHETGFGLELESLLREKSPTTPVYVNLSAISLNDPFSKPLLEKVQKPLNEGDAERQYRIYAPEEDVSKQGGFSLPILNPKGNHNGKKEKHYIVTNQSHHSIVGALAKRQTEQCFRWIHRQNKLPDQRIILNRGKVTLVENKEIKLIEVVDNRPLLKKIKNIVQAILNHAATLLTRLTNLILTNLIKRNSDVVAEMRDGKLCFSENSLPWKSAKESAGLYLFVHGWRSSPIRWNRYCNEIQKLKPDAHLFVPQVPFLGDCALEGAADPLLEVIKDYIKKFPGKPVTLLGASNGGRIINYLENNLSPEILSSSPLSLVSLAGLHYGTKLVDIAANTGLVRLVGLDDALIEEFRWANPKAKQQLLDWNE
ncbi:MAG TPA: alpha/beta hydrolase, partial [Waddliaceae bacterium]